MIELNQYIKSQLRSCFQPHLFIAYVRAIHRCKKLLATAIHNSSLLQDWSCYQEITKIRGMREEKRERRKGN